MKDRLSKIIWVLIWIISIAALTYFFVFYRLADSKKVEPIEESQYSVFTGRNVYEYWRGTLPENQQQLYDELKEAYLQFLPTFSTQVEGKITVEQMSNVYTALYQDHPEIFWMDSYQAVSTLTDNINKHKKIELYYAYTEAESKEIKSRLEKNYLKIIEEAREQETDFKKIKLVHDRLIQTTTYTKYGKDEVHEYQSIVEIFDSGNTVCAGYSFAFKFIMDELGIDSIVSRDVSHANKSNNHSWNMVKLSGTWYNIDITWDGEKSKDGVIAYNYFLEDNDSFYRTHKMQEGIPTNEE